MLSILVVCFGLIAADDGALSAPKDSADRAAYEAAQAKAGRDAKAHVRLALWCESHGLGAERMKHLAMAVLYDPSNALARGLMGLVAYQGKWERPDQVSRQAQDDPERKALLQQYLQRRAQTPETADGHWKLAAWCEQNGLTAPGQRPSPSRGEARSRAGYRLGSTWVSRSRAAVGSSPNWWPPPRRGHRISRRPTGTGSRSSSVIAFPFRARMRRAAANAEQALAQITDRDAVPMVWATFGRGDATLQKVAVQVLGQIDDASASRSLVLLAVFSGSATVRGQAVATLRRKDAREFASMLIGMILQPIEYEVKKVRRPGSGWRALDQGPGLGTEREAAVLAARGPVVRPAARGPGRISTRTACRSSPDPTSIGQTGSICRSGLIPRADASFGSPEEPVHGPAHTQRARRRRPEDRPVHAPGLSRLRHFIIIVPPIISQDPFAQMAIAQTGWMGPANPMTKYNFTVVQGIQIPIGRMALEAQKSAATAQKQLENDVASIEEYNAILEPDQRSRRAGPQGRSRGSISARRPSSGRGGMST